MASSAPLTIVTGAARGIGAAIATCLVESGHQVVAADLDWSDPLVASGPSITTCELDVRDSAAVAETVARANAIGEVSGLVNCAGVLRATSLEAIDDADMALMWDVNVAGIARLCAAAARDCPRLQAIVNIGSISARLPHLPGISLYGATKAGVDALTRALAKELGPRGVRVNGLAPGFIEVPMSAGMRAVSGGEEDAAARVPLRRMGRPEEIATATEFLLSANASYVNGAVLVVDGGASSY